MNVHKIRTEMRMGRSIFDLPLRVTFYARVSTDKDEQINSLENQIQYYTEWIQSKPHWTFVPGYIDEGISGTSTKKRDSFNRMIADAKAGCFDFIITKEISRFSRSTLDSIKYTQELLECDVGVLFQNDNINTLDSDSEFRLVVMAGVAQDEVRKLSERLKFGFRQSIKNGRVLGNDKLWGYDKKDCVLTINEEEAEIVRIIFDLYANKGLGVRRISLALFDMGYTSREGNEFNVATIRHILTNPKYKGWYCGNKTQNVDYRTKRKVFLEESEWVMYPDPTIPAIVSEELWDRANAIYKERSREIMERAPGASYHNQYAYSAKIFCEEHEVTFHRQLLKSGKGEREVWQCKVYRQRGRKACSAPQLRTEELNEIMRQIFTEVMRDKTAIIESLITVLQNVPQDVDYSKARRRIEEELEQVNAKKDRLLELSMAGALSIPEFKKRNDSFNETVLQLQGQLDKITAEEENSRNSVLQIDKIRKVLEKELSFEDGVNSALVASILDRIIVKRESTKEEIHLDIHLKMGQRYESVYQPQKNSAKSNPLKNTTHPM
ncbi:MAG: recombinase family protein [Oscillospiraceae bacterium]|nr:recombinase family protein [Oscillospiraceae bacterium]